MDILIEYIAQGEHLMQDFKFRIDDQKKIARTLCAFANTEGGRLLIGVKDNGKIAGVDPQEEFFMIEGAAGLFCKPEVLFKSVVHQVDHKLVLEVVVEKDSEIIHSAQDDDGNPRCRCFGLLQHIKTAEFWQHQIQDRHIVSLLQNQCQALLTIGGVCDLMSSRSQPLEYKLGNLVFIFD